MPDPSGTHTDGSVTFGSQQTTIDGVNYIAEDISVSRGSRDLDSSNEFGVPNKQVLIRTKQRGSATLQLETTATLSPSLFAVVPFKPVNNPSAVNYLIMEVGDRFTQDGITKVSISFVEKLN